MMPPSRTLRLLGAVLLRTVSAIDWGPTLLDPLPCPRNRGYTLAYHNNWRVRGKGLPPWELPTAPRAGA